MDSFAIGLKVAHRLLEDKVLKNFVEERYASFKDGIGKEIVSNQTNFKELEKYALNLGEIENKSGQLERLKATINQYLLTELDRKSTRLNSSHVAISYAVFCLKKKNK